MDKFNYFIEKKAVMLIIEFTSDFYHHLIIDAD